VEKTITATEANRKFSEMLRGVRAGHSYRVTSHGKVVACVVPGHGDAAEQRRRERAKRELLEHLRTRKPLNIQWKREDAYDEDVR
jgi:prevent-host-death family protein